MKTEQEPLKPDALFMKGMMKGWNNRPLDAASGQEQVRAEITAQTMSPTGSLDNFRGQSMAEAIQQERDWYNSRS